MDTDTFISAFAAYLPKLIAALPIALVVLLGGFILTGVYKRAISVLVGRTRLSPTGAVPLRRAGSTLILVFTFVAILGVFGFELGGIWAVLSTILAMVAIGFVAVWSLISHTTATVIILFIRPFEIGDYVAFPPDDIKGRVIDMNFFFTTLELDNGTLYQVPNNLFFQRILLRRKDGTPVPPKIDPPPATPQLKP